MRIPKFSITNVLLLCILILALFLRLRELGKKSLWLDEAFNVAMANNSVFSWNNPLPPLYFAFLHFWLYIGKSEFIVRLPSVILGVLSVYIVYKIGKILFDEGEGLISAFLMSISLTGIYFSQQALYYAFFNPFSIISVYFFLKMEEKQDIWNKILFLVSIILSFYSHYFTLLLIFVFFIFKMWKYRNEREKPKELRSFFILVVIFFILISPIFSSFISESQAKAKASNDVFYQIHISPEIIREIFYYLLINTVNDGESIFFILMLFFLFGAITFVKGLDIKKVFLIMWIFLPIALAAVLANIIPTIHIRYLVFILPALLIVIAHGIMTFPNQIYVLIKNVDELIPKKLNILIIVLIIISLIFLTFPILDSYYDSKNYNWRGVAEFVEKNAENKSNIILIPGYNIIPFNYYNKAKNKINIIEYSTFSELKNLSYENNTYLIISDDIYALSNEDFNNLIFWQGKNMELVAELSGIVVLKNITLTKSNPLRWAGKIYFI